MSAKKVNCVFVHGWGMNREVWQPLLDSLPEWIIPLAIDLPGHGQNAATGFQTLDDLVAALNNRVDDAAIWIGWSLGGLAVAQLALQYPEKVNAIMLVSSSPCFVQKKDWSSGMPASIFDEFSTQLEEDFSGTIQRFLSLQVRGSASGRQLLRSLRKKILAQPAANIDALRSGLQVLKNTDLRTHLSGVNMPVSWVLGGQDGLVKAELAQQLEQLVPGVATHVFEKAAHAPFLSHLEEFREQLIAFTKRVT
ncbi:MAG: pimeloyl-ACP methyl ester esterase BioH [Gammaproteobacteria bacterium]|nr:pimeloyl-ACP methyl ester esterase BioH [Gammaproteobacteria bacterium]